MTFLADLNHLSSWPVLCLVSKYEVYNTLVITFLSLGDLNDAKAPPD